MFEYEVLRFIWWLLIGVLVRVMGRNDVERRIMINSIAPHWDGNQVWLITAGGALFAA